MIDYLDDVLATREQRAAELGVSAVASGAAHGEVRPPPAGARVPVSRCPCCVSFHPHNPRARPRPTRSTPTTCMQARSRRRRRRQRPRKAVMHCPAASSGPRPRPTTAKATLAAATRRRRVTAVASASGSSSQSIALVLFTARKSDNNQCIHKEEVSPVLQPFRTAAGS